MTTGYWANEHGRSSGYHIEHEGRGLCGYRPAPSMKYQVCAPGIHIPYVECPRCLSRGAVLVTTQDAKVSA